MAESQQIDIPGVGLVEFPASMSDADVTAAAQRLHAEHTDVTRSRQTLTAANQRPLPPTPTLGDEFTLSKMGGRALSGLKGEAEGFAGGLAAPVAALGYGLWHPVNAAKGAATGIAGAGVLAAHAVTHLPETWDAAKTVAFTIGKDPEHIGQVAGGLDAMLATPTLIKGALRTRLGAAVSAGVSDAANKIPGVEAGRKAWAASAPVVTPEPVAAAPVAPASTSVLSAAEKAQLAKQGYTPELIAKIEAQNAPSVAPVASHATMPRSLPEPPAGAADIVDRMAGGVDAPSKGNGLHPLTAPRVDVGAEAVAKSEGLTKQGVRDVTGPLYGEQPGEAAPVFPESAYQRMAGKMRAMHPSPGDPAGDVAAWDARLQYANQSRDPKSLSQLISMMRAWRDVHMAVPAAVGGGLTVNALVRKRLQQEGR